MQTFRVNLKTLLYFVLPNQYCHVVVRENRGRFLGYIISRIVPTPLMSLIYSIIVLYDMYHSRHTHLIGERTIEHSPCSFYICGFTSMG